MQTLGNLLDNLHQEVYANPQLGFIDRYETLANEYKFMLNFLLDGYKDNRRGEVYDSLLKRVTEFDTELRSSVMFSSDKYFTTLLKELRNVDTSTVSLIEHLHNDSTPKAHFQTIHEAFIAILTSAPWKSQDSRQWLSHLLSDETPIDDVCTLTSAIMLSCSMFFSIEKFRTLAMLHLTAESELVRQRAFIGWLVCWNKCQKPFEEERDAILAQVLDDSESAASDIVEFFIQLYISNTPATEQQLNTNLFNKVNVLNQDSDIESIINSGKNEQNIEEMEKEIHKILDMQKQGVDLFFKGFSQMKRFPFFYKLENWFVPFSTLHPDITEQMNKLQNMKFTEIALTKGPFCDSDKYSFVYSLSHVIDQLPDNIRKMMDNGEVALLGTDMESSIDERKSNPQYIRRMYLQDLYRFFRLFPQHHFESFFEDKEEDLMGIFRFLGSNADEARMQLAHFYFRKKEYDMMNHIIYPVSNDNVSKRMLRAAYELATDDTNNLTFCAIGNLVQSYPENMKLVHLYAKYTYKMGKYMIAAANFDILSTRYPDNLSYKLKYLISQAYVGITPELINEAYRLDFEHEDNTEVKRTIGWIELLAKRPDKAVNLFNSISDTINLAYSHFLIGNVREAISILKEKGITAKSLKENIANDQALFSIYDTPSSDLCLFVDALAQ